jgi:protease-4
MTLYDSSAAYEQAGIKAIPIDSGKFKSAGTPGTEVTSEQIAMFQDIVNEHFERFASAVKVGRKMSDKDFDDVKDAQILSAKKAKSVGLIDGISTFAEIMNSMVKPQNGRSTNSGRARLALMDI